MHVLDHCLLIYFKVAQFHFTAAMFKFAIIRAQITFEDGVNKL